MIWYLYRVELNQGGVGRRIRVIDSINGYIKYVVIRRYCNRHAVGALARFNKFPTFRSCKASVRVLIYLRDTTEGGIEFTGSDFELFAYSDAD